MRKTWANVFDIWCYWVWRTVTGDYKVAFLLTRSDTADDVQTRANAVDSLKNLTLSTTIDGVRTTSDCIVNNDAGLWTLPKTCLGLCHQAVRTPSFKHPALAVTCSLLPCRHWSYVDIRHWSFQLCDDGPWVTVRFQLQLPMPGTLCRLSSEMNSHWRPFDGNWVKTVLFRTSFVEDANTWAASLLTRDGLVFVRWPCNVLCVIMPP